MKIFEGVRRSAAASGCPSVERALKLELKASDRLLTGRLSAVAPACRAGQPVSIWEARRGKDRRIDRARSSTSGRFRTRLGRRTGRFYAKVPSSVGTVPDATNRSRSSAPRPTLGGI